jgi:hypothetical protein
MIGRDMESTPRSDAAIIEFWKWFCTVSDRLAQDYEDQEILDELDSRVSTLGEVAWELGPGKARECALTITPDGDRQLLSWTQRIVAMAPELPDWEFYCARQKKEWELQFSIEAEAGQLLEVDARSWRYALLRVGEGIFDIILEQAGLPDVGEEARYTAAVVLLDGLLGEATRLLSIADIEPTKALDSELSKKANSIAHLDDHLATPRK